MTADDSTAVRKGARRFLRELSDGTPPPPPDPLTPWLTVGQEGTVQEFKQDLEAVRNGGFRTLILVGGPGAGKSQLLVTIEDASRRAKFITSYFEHDPASRVAFNRPDNVYRRLVETLRLPDDPRRATDPLRSLLDRWVAASLPKLHSTHRTMAVAYRLAEVGLLPQVDSTFPYRTRLALAGYVMATEAQDEEAKATFLEVLKGENVLNRDLLNVCDDLGWRPKGNIGWTPGPYDTKFYFLQLRSLVWIMRALDYNGLVVLFDEVTAIVDLQSRSREKAYKVIDAVLVNDFAIEGFYPVFSYMPAFVNRLLSDRSSVEEDLVNRWGDLWRLRQREVMPLSEEQTVELLYRVSQLHGLAFDWDAWDSVEPAARKLARDAVQAGSTTRDVIRHGVALFEHTYELTRNSAGPDRATPGMLRPSLSECGAGGRRSVGRRPCFADQPGNAPKQQS